MKIMQLWRLVALLLWLVLIGSGCTSRKSEATSIDAINQEIADSFRTHNLDFVKQAISQGKREARDSDAYYNFVVQDIIRYFYTAQLDSVLLSADSVIHYLSGKTLLEAAQRSDDKVHAGQRSLLYPICLSSRFDALLSKGGVPVCRAGRR